MKTRAVAVFAMVGAALLAAGCAPASAPQSASQPPAAASQTPKTGSTEKARSDAPLCETHDELIAAAYEYDGGHTPDISGCTALTPGAEAKVVALGASGDVNAVQIETQGHVGWTKSYYLQAPGS